MAEVDGDVRYPVYLETGDRKIQELSLRIKFPAALVRFNDLEKGFLIENVKMKLGTEIQAEADASSVLAIRMACEKDESLPAGLLFYLKFHIERATPLGSEIRLANEAQSAAGLAVAFPDAVIRVSPRPREEQLLFGCFFYMH